jgi:hypothetical protein
VDYNKFLHGKMFLVAVDEEQYPDKIVDLLKIITNAYNKICYLCFSKPYSDVVEDIKRIGLDVSKFFFIDVLTSHYKKPTPVENCIFIESPTNIIKIGEAIKIAITEKKCEEIFIDTISSLLIYQQGFYIIKLAHDLKSGKIGKLKNLKQSVLVALKGSEMLTEGYEHLFKDLSMFADEVISYDKGEKGHL